MGRKSISESISLILAGVLIGLAAGAVQATAVEPVTAMIAHKRGYGTLSTSPQSRFGIWLRPLWRGIALLIDMQTEKEIVFDPSYSQLI